MKDFKFIREMDMKIKKLHDEFEEKIYPHMEENKDYIEEFENYIKKEEGENLIKYKKAKEEYIYNEWKKGIFVD